MPMGRISVDKNEVGSSRAIVLFRRAEWEDWHNSNPILAHGEPAIDETYKMIKIGDGITLWDDLPYSTMEDLINYMTGEK